MIEINNCIHFSSSKINELSNIRWVKIFVFESFVSRLSVEVLFSFGLLRIIGGWNVHRPVSYSLSSGSISNISHGGEGTETMAILLKVIFPLSSHLGISDINSIFNKKCIKMLPKSTFLDYIFTTYNNLMVLEILVYLKT